MNNIILIGFMGSGKSSVGMRLAEKLDVDLLDMDAEIVKTEGMPITDIFEQKGEYYFRDLETRYLQTLLTVNDKVISTGGGVVLREENVKLLKQIGIVIFLYADSAQIYEHVKGDTSRPLLQGDHVEARIRHLLDTRDPMYLNAANIIIQTTGKTIENITDEIITLL